MKLWRRSLLHIHHCLPLKTCLLACPGSFLWRSASRCLVRSSYVSHHGDNQCPLSVCNETWGFVILFFGFLDVVASAAVRKLRRYRGTTFSHVLQRCEAQRGADEDTRRFWNGNSLLILLHSWLSDSISYFGATGLSTLPSTRVTSVSQLREQTWTHQRFAEKP